jgi:hypothetical protein
MGVALIAGWLGLGAAARAQSMAPTPYGAARMPEPVPCGPASPNLIPGPLTAENAPPPPPDCLSLPAGHSGAFQCECYVPDCHAYFSAGSMMLQRQRLGHGPIAVFDPNVSGIDTGLLAPPRSQKAVDFNDAVPALSYGPSGTLGFLWGNQAIELTSYYIVGNTGSDTTALQGRLDAFFFNPPRGFEGDVGLWNQADLIRTSVRTNLWNTELNYRYTEKAVTTAELILGVRYLNLQDQLGVFTDDDGLTFRDINGNPDPLRQATYSIRANNRIVAGQVGLECEQCICPWLSLGVHAKGAWGVNFVDVHYQLDRGDGFNAFAVRRNSTAFSHLYEFGVTLNFLVLEKMRIRGGYNCLWLVDVASSVDQVDFNLANPLGRHSNDGSIFFHGPSVEFQFLF